MPSAPESLKLLLMDKRPDVCARSSFSLALFPPYYSVLFVVLDAHLAGRTATVQKRPKSQHSSTKATFNVKLSPLRNEPIRHPLTVRPLPQYKYLGAG